MKETTPTGSVVFRRLCGMLRPEWSWIGAALVLLIVSMPGELFPAFIWGYIVDELIVKHTAGRSVLAWVISLHGRITDLYWLLISSVVLMFVVYVFSLTASTISTVILQRSAQKFVYRLRNLVYHKLQSQSLGYLQRQRSGDMISRAMGDVDELQNFVVNSIDLIIGDGGLWLATVAIVLYMSWQVAGSSLAPLLIVYFMLRYFNAKVRPIYTAARQAAGDVTNRLQENLSGVTVIKIFNREQQEAAAVSGHDALLLPPATPRHHREESILPLHKRGGVFQQCFHDRGGRIPAFALSAWTIHDRNAHYLPCVLVAIIRPRPDFGAAKRSCPARSGGGRARV